ncbi:response regulator transcription factor [Lacihabitans lacunae]|uniref:Response regulator transcription factor n=1 Tax=Lacihabitans lacunae TaxID=1028214 RepID=A0ABV7YYC0_9BACT
MNVLIIEDEIKLAKFIYQGLTENGYQCEMTHDGKTGLKLAYGKEYQIILMDVNMPEINGFDLCEKLRENNINTPVLMLTGMANTSSKVMGLNSGADDYLAKPFEFDELLARIRALLRRNSLSGTEIKSQLLKIADLEVDTHAKVVKRAGNIIPLAAKEFFLLEYLMKNKNRVVSKSQIFSEVWDLNADLDGGKVEVYISKLRNAVDKNFPVKLIHTIIDLGYIIKEA